jgi:peptidoglycan/xylan/chitin deacetylase (PgdA/CDA1 family)
MHDFGGDRRQTLAALGPIVRGLRKRGLEPVTLDDLYREASPP